MPKFLLPLHILNGVIGCLCTLILSLVIRSIVLKRALNTSSSPEVRTIGMNMLMWPGMGEIVDTLLFLAGLVVVLLYKDPMSGLFSALNLPCAALILLLWSNIV